MDTTPDDIRVTARLIAHVAFVVGPEQDDLTDAIAAALVAERERAVDAARPWGTDCVARVRSPRPY